jgi:predicted Zn-dependent peptidase
MRSLTAETIISAAKKHLRGANLTDCYAGKAADLKEFT